MTTAGQPSSHLDELSLLMSDVDNRFATSVVLVTVVAPIVAYLTGFLWVMFYLHLVLGALWFGLNILFKFLVDPALKAAPEEAAGAVSFQLLPPFIFTAHALSVGALGSGVALGIMLGHMANPTIWLWGAVGVGVLLLFNGFGPLHLATTRMVVELDKEEPDSERLDALSGLASQWGIVQTAFMLFAFVMMVGLRGLL